MKNKYSRRQLNRRMDKTHVRLTKRERDRLKKSVKSALNPTRSRSGQILYNIISDMSASASVYYYPGWSLEAIRKHQANKEWRDEFYKQKAELIRLKKRRMIVVQDKGNKLVAALTAKGKSQILRNLIIDTHDKLPKGVNCYVAYDIPEAAKNSRSELRRLLKKSGFQLMQKSLWRSENDVADLMQLFVEDAGVSEWVSIVVGEEK